MVLEVITPDASILDYANTYLKYLEDSQVTVNPEVETRIGQILKHTRWEDPQSGMDWNNCGVFSPN
jgi:hypothetical protein